MSSTDTARLIRLIQFAQQQEATKALATASLAFMIYDILLTLDYEARHMWSGKPRINLVKFLFYFCRWYTPIPGIVNLYTQFAREPSPTLCRVSGQFVSLSAILTFVAVDAILMLRVWALYDRKKVMRWALIGGLCVTVLAYIIMLGIAAPDLKSSHISPLPGVITGCMQTAPMIYFAIFGLTAFVEAALFGMTLFKVFSHIRANGRLPVIQHIFSSGTLYFLGVFVACVFTLASHFIRLSNPKIQLPGANAYFVPAISSVACSRLILGIRELHSPYVEPPTSFTVPSRSRSGREDFEMEPTTVKESRVVFRTMDDLDTENGKRANGTYLSV